MHQLNLAKIIEINSNLGGKEPSPRFQARDSNQISHQTGASSWGRPNEGISWLKVMKIL